jgi:hypothetical protein
MVEEILFVVSAAVTGVAAAELLWRHRRKVREEKRARRELSVQQVDIGIDFPVHGHLDERQIQFRFGRVETVKPAPWLVSYVELMMPLGPDPTHGKHSTRISSFRLDITFITGRGSFFRSECVSASSTSSLPTCGRNTIEPW